ncbi:polyketide synthase dehydratase domain-containing protein, partial [Streptomyces morookaense]
ALLDAALHALAAGGLVSLADGPRLPFAWSGVAVQAAGAAMVRVKLSRTGTDAVALTVADADGGPVASVESLTLRAVSAEQLRGAGDPDQLFAVEWTPLVLPSTADASTIESVADIDALRESAAEVDVVVVPCPVGTSDDTATRVREVV